MGKKMATSTFPMEQFKNDEPRIAQAQVSAFTIPTATPESDGTLKWDKTTLVLVEISGGGKTGIGFSYADTSTAILIHDKLAEIVTGRSALAIGSCWEAMRTAI